MAQEYNVCIIYGICCFMYFLNFIKIMYFLNFIEIHVYTYNVMHVFHLFETSRMGCRGCRELVVMANVATFCFFELENVCLVIEKSGKSQGNLPYSTSGNPAFTALNKARRDLVLNVIYPGR